MIESVTIPLLVGDLSQACSISALADLAIVAFLAYGGYKCLSIMFEDFVARKKYVMQKVSNEAYLDKYVRSYQIALIKKQSEAEGLEDLGRIMEEFPKADFMDGIKEDLSTKMKTK
jgi:hypothetical protein